VVGPKAGRGCATVAFLVERNESITFVGSIHCLLLCVQTRYDDYGGKIARRTSQEAIF
jgi:hypothetical protein